ncbi:hypothetical protein [Bradyrhizobium sp. RP6]|uniref:hypothetical protein n=1 Tax=Bradyrhizobium sp. RP6 TaxID=2489596 RepID=UPI000F5331A9|nr:hypothetical protein [Bradyrhizobium sp. RP6]RQH15686.1 hypothetical protein EHH60_00350 [Bradyrhizobium sp. RP6]
MASPKTGKPRGRPPKLYQQDSDRYILAFAQAAEIVFCLSQNDAFDLTVCCLFGREVEHKKGRRRQPADTQAVGWVTRVGPTPLQNRAAAFITKVSRPISEADALHHAVLVTACKNALEAKDGRVIAPLLDLLASIGEREFGERCLVPIVLQKV